MPPNSSKADYGPVSVEYLGHPLSLVFASLSESIESLYPLTFEQLYMPSGMVSYSTIVDFQTVGT